MGCINRASFQSKGNAMKRKLLAAVLGLGVLISGSIVAAPAATAATGSCTFLATWSASSRSGTVASVTCSGTRKVRVEVRFYSSPSSSTDLYGYGAFVGTGGVSTFSPAAPAVVTGAKGVTN